MQIELEAGEWYTPMGPTSLSVDLAAGEVRGVRVPVRVDKVGLRVLSGSLQAGATTHAVQFPPGARDSF